MTTTAILTMVLIVGLVWGGLLCFILMAVRKERRKREAAEPGSS